jgi:hypothetical protein
MNQSQREGTPMGHLQLLIIVAGLLAAIGLCSTTNAAVPMKSEELRQQLLRRMQEDQEARKAVMALVQSGHIGNLDQTKSEDHPLAMRLRYVDRKYTARLKEIIDEFGWPGKSLVGRDGAHAAWLMVQHADQDVPFQKRCLTLLVKAVKDGEASGHDFAYLVDRVRVANKEKQLYGTQLQQVDGKLIP